MLSTLEGFGLPTGGLQLAIKTYGSPEVEFAGPRLSDRFFHMLLKHVVSL